MRLGWARWPGWALWQKLAAAARGASALIPNGLLGRSPGFHQGSCEDPPLPGLPKGASQSSGQACPRPRGWRQQPRPLCSEMPQRRACPQHPHPEVQPTFIPSHHPAISFVALPGRAGFGGKEQCAAGFVFCQLRWNRNVCFIPSDIASRVLTRSSACQQGWHLLPGAFPPPSASWERPPLSVGARFDPSDHPSLSFPGRALSTWPSGRVAPQTGSPLSSVTWPPPLLSGLELGLVSVHPGQGPIFFPGLGAKS